MDGEVVAFRILFVGLVLLGVVGLLTLCFRKPDVGRFLARIFAVLAMGPGACFLVLGFVACLSIENANFFGPNQRRVDTIGIGFGMGAGLMTSGIVALVLSFIRTRKKPPALQDSSSPSL